MKRLLLRRGGVTGIDALPKLQAYGVQFADSDRDTADRLTRLLFLRSGWHLPFVRSLTSNERCQHELELA
jgi:hypothetical protein